MTVKATLTKRTGEIEQKTCTSLHEIANQVEADPKAYEGVIAKILFSVKDLRQGKDNRTIKIA